MTAPTLAKLKVKLFTDGADKAQIVEMAKQPWIAGFTTNPSLLKKAGVSDYAVYARDLVAAVPDRHISFEVFSDDVAEIVGYRGKLAFDTNRPDGPPRKLLDISKISALGWAAKTPLRDGLQAAYKDFLARGAGVRER